MIMDVENKESELSPSNQQLKTLFQLVTVLVARSKLKNRHYLNRPNLQVSKESAWVKLYNSKDDRSFINVMGLDVANFE
jgi:nitrate/nitrite-specific signal transduction histidine kinase